MTDVVLAACITAGGAVLAAIITGLFGVFIKSDHQDKK